MTLVRIAKALQDAGKPLSIRSIYYNIEHLGIRPVSKVQQKPQLYPHDAPKRILAHYGLA